eukprot:TRINITY_DN1016_c0_g1_i2.p1 TRINITY_DN1016_c0_g1~~TRINITY_DN1016_c0_g1_i2.p1  ORF type:complete len:2339 (+),score=508.86 TRINITY_DN1016_c0_g1_i2:367-7017(+)
MDGRGMTALHWAASQGHHDCVESLIKRGADVNARDDRRRVPLHYSASMGQTVTALQLLAAKATVNAVDIQGRTALHQAAGCGETKMVELLIEMKINLNTQDADGGTALHYASQLGQVDSVRTLINAGCSVNLQDTRGKTALHWVAAGGLEEVATVLLGSLKVEVDRRDNAGRAPIHYAALRDERVGIVQLLLTRGSNASQRDSAEITPMHFAAYSGATKIVDLLIKHHVDPSVRDGRQRTSLHWACGVGNVALSKLLIDAGCDKNTMDGKRFTPLDWAREAKHEHVVAFLKGIGAEQGWQLDKRQAVLNAEILRLRGRPIGSHVNDIAALIWAATMVQRAWRRELNRRNARLGIAPKSFLAQSLEGFGASIAVEEQFALGGTEEERQRRREIAMAAEARWKAELAELESKKKQIKADEEATVASWRENERTRSQQPKEKPPPTPEPLSSAALQQKIDQHMLDPAAPMNEGTQLLRHLADKYEDNLLTPVRTPVTVTPEPDVDSGMATASSINIVVGSPVHTKAIAKVQPLIQKAGDVHAELFRSAATAGLTSAQAFVLAKMSTLNLDSKQLGVLQQQLAGQKPTENVKLSPSVSNLFTQASKLNLTQAQSDVFMQAASAGLSAPQTELLKEAAALSNTDAQLETLIATAGEKYTRLLRQASGSGLTLHQSQLLKRVAMAKWDWRSIQALRQTLVGKKTTLTDLPQPISRLLSQILSADIATDLQALFAQAATPEPMSEPEADALQEAALLPERWDPEPFPERWDSEPLPERSISRTPSVKRPLAEPKPRESKRPSSPDNVSAQLDTLIAQIGTENSALITRAATCDLQQPHIDLLQAVARTTFDRRQAENLSQILHGKKVDVSTAPGIIGEVLRQAAAVTVPAQSIPLFMQSAGAMLTGKQITALTEAAQLGATAQPRTSNETKAAQATAAREPVPALTVVPPSDLIRQTSQVSLDALQRALLLQVASMKFDSTQIAQIREAATGESVDTSSLPPAFQKLVQQVSQLMLTPSQADVFASAAGVALDNQDLKRLKQATSSEASQQLQLLVQEAGPQLEPLFKDVANAGLTSAQADLLKQIATAGLDPRFAEAVRLTIAAQHAPQVTDIPTNFASVLLEVEKAAIAPEHAELYKRAVDSSLNSQQADLLRMAASTFPKPAEDASLFAGVARARFQPRQVDLLQQLLNADLDAPHIAALKEILTGKFVDVPEPLASLFLDVQKADLSVAQQQLIFDVLESRPNGRSGELLVRMARTPMSFEQIEAVRAVVNVQGADQADKVLEEKIVEVETRAVADKHSGLFDQIAEAGLNEHQAVIFHDVARAGLDAKLFEILLLVLQAGARAEVPQAPGMTEKLTTLFKTAAQANLNPQQADLLKLVARARLDTNQAILMRNMANSELGNRIDLQTALVRKTDEAGLDANQAKLFRHVVSAKLTDAQSECMHEFLRTNNTTLLDRMDAKTIELFQRAAAAGLSEQQIVLLKQVSQAGLPEEHLDHFRNIALKATLDFEKAEISRKADLIAQAGNQAALLEEGIRARLDAKQVDVFRMVLHAKLEEPQIKLLRLVASSGTLDADMMSTLDADIVPLFKTAAQSQLSEKQVAVLTKIAAAELDPKQVDVFVRAFTRMPARRLPRSGSHRELTLQLQRRFSFGKFPSKADETSQEASRRADAWKLVAEARLLRRKEEAEALADLRKLDTQRARAIVETRQQAKRDAKELRLRKMEDQARRIRDEESQLRLAAIRAREQLQRDAEEREMRRKKAAEDLAQAKMKEERVRERRVSQFGELSSEFSSTNLSGLSDGSPPTRGLPPLRRRQSLMPLPRGSDSMFDLGADISPRTSTSVSPTVRRDSPSVSPLAPPSVSPRRNSPRVSPFASDASPGTETMTSLDVSPIAPEQQSKSSQSTVPAQLTPDPVASTAAVFGDSVSDANSEERRQRKRFSEDEQVRRTSGIARLKEEPRVARKAVHDEVQKQRAEKTRLEYLRLDKERSQQRDAELVAESKRASEEAERRLKAKDQIRAEKRKMAEARRRASQALGLAAYQKSLAPLVHKAPSAKQQKAEQATTLGPESFERMYSAVRASFLDTGELPSLHAILAKPPRSSSLDPSPRRKPTVRKASSQLDSSEWSTSPASATSTSAEVTAGSVQLAVSETPADTETPLTPQLSPLLKLSPRRSSVSPGSPAKPAAPPAESDSVMPMMKPGRRASQLVQESATQRLSS